MSHSNDLLNQSKLSNTNDGGLRLDAGPDSVMKTRQPLPAGTFVTPTTPQPAF
jgi:hypothetical protein